MSGVGVTFFLMVMNVWVESFSPNQRLKQTQLISINPWHQTSHKLRHNWATHVFWSQSGHPQTHWSTDQTHGRKFSLFACIRVWVTTCCSFTPDCHVTRILKMCTPTTCATAKEGGRRRSSSSPENSSVLGVLVIMISGKRSSPVMCSNLSIPPLSDTGPTPSSPTVCTFFYFN